MASRKVLLGMVPVCTQTPPMVRLRSMTATFLRSLAAQIAAFCPAGPLPTTIRSYTLLPPTSVGRGLIIGSSCVGDAIASRTRSYHRCAGNGSGLDAKLSGFGDFAGDFIAR